MLNPKMAIFLDELNADNGWSKVGSWVDSTYNITGGELTISAGAGGKNTSAWCRTGFNGLNASITVRVTGTSGIPQIHLRESSSGNYLTVYIDPADGYLHIGKVVGGTYTEFDSILSGIFSGLSYTFTAKVYGNWLYGAVLINDGTEQVFAKLSYIHSDVSSFTGTSHGIGATSGTQRYLWVDMRTLTNLTSIVCVGDSNVGPDSRTKWPNLVQKRHFKEGFTVNNQGVGGKATQWFIDNKATTIDPFFITGVGVDNILSIATGNNDYAVYDLTGAQCYDKQLELITYAKTLGYRCELATLIPWVGAVDPGGPLVFVDALNALIRAGYVTNGYTLCDIHTAFGAVNGQQGTSPSGLTNADTIHYSTDLGHSLAAKTHSYSLSRNYRTSVT